MAKRAAVLGLGTFHLGQASLLIGCCAIEVASELYLGPLPPWPESRLVLVSILAFNAFTLMLLNELDVDVYVARLRELILSTNLVAVSLLAALHFDDE